MTSIRNMSVGRKLMFTMIATTLIVVAVVGYVMWREANNNTEVVGLTTAQAISNQVVTLRSFYTAEVVRPAKAAGIDVNYDFAEKDQTIPLPATMVKALGAEIRKRLSGNRRQAVQQLSVSTPNGDSAERRFRKSRPRGIGERS